MENLLNAFADPILKALPKLPQAVLTLAVGWVVIRLFHWIFEKVLKLARTPRTLFAILSSIANVLLWIILIALVFQSLGLTQVALALSGSVAIIGIAIGTGANSLVQDVIAGLFLARDPDFDVGYTIKTGEVEGIIQRIDTRKVRIMAKNGQTHVLPNSNLDKASWVVLKRDDQ